MAGPTDAPGSGKARPAKNTGVDKKGGSTSARNYDPTNAPSPASNSKVGMGGGKPNVTSLYGTGKQKNRSVS